MFINFYPPKRLRCIYFGNNYLRRSEIHTFLFLPRTALQTVVLEHPGTSHWPRCARAPRSLALTLGRLQFELCFCYY